MFQRFLGFVYLSAVSQLASLTGAQAECPNQLNPQRAVVRYRGSVAVNCSTSVSHKGIGWESSEGAVVKTRDSLITWRVSHLTEWDIRPVCYINREGQCVVELPVIIYKTPDNVSISIVNHTGPMIAGRQYQLQCDVHDVAPVQYLTVKWYKGQTLLDQTTFTEDSKTPVNVNPSVLISPDRDNDEAQYKCEAELDLGAEGPQPPPKKTSGHLNVELHYKPKHSKSAETIIQKDVVTLNCTVKANPAPVYTWYSDHLKVDISSSVLQSSTLSPGNYMCNATNYLGSDSKVFIIESYCCEIRRYLVVVRYGGSVEVNCNTSILHKGMGWESSEGAVVKTSDSLITWRVSHLTEWDIQSFCYINYERQCIVDLLVTVYKTPDNVSISIVNHTGPMIAGRQYQLQCDVQNVAPVQYLTVKWYKGQTLLNQTTFTEDSKTPVNETVTLLIRPDRADDEAQYRCEAELDLGAEGPQPPPKETSDPLNITVYYKPKHSSSTETIIQKDVVTLNCTVKANPAPVYTWYSDHLKEEINSSVLQSSTLSPGNYTCNATNYLGSDSKVFIFESTGPGYYMCIATNSK
ncbi:vascular cell adhesion protein 1-like [Carassius auratus]|uniref:Vascular cell adhesion protein 1-like n=1 Tax=Carassius auratus TaxID=7957 RepID=A0A6P6NJZ0_CARAU|nr:vascular cell adhesion protein 1-like [Carassius auratus]